MKIKNIEIEIIQGDISGLKAGLVVPSFMGDAPDEQSIRDYCRRYLQKAKAEAAGSIAFPALGCGQGQLPVVGAAKIMAQEVMKFAKFEKSSVARVIFCLDREDLYRQFEQTVSGYLTHIQDDLGNGPYVTVDIIIELPEGIILIERSNPPYGWALPGGFVDNGESLETAAVREAKEETNMDLEGLRQFHTYSDPGRDPRFHTVSTVFIAGGKGTPQSGDDAKGLKVVKYADLTKLAYAFDHNKIIEDYIREARKAGKAVG